MDPQAPPPHMDLLAPQAWHDFFDEDEEWKLQNRPIAGDGLIATDVANGRRFDVVGASSGDGTLYGLDVYLSPYTGGGTPPADQALRVKVRRGYCPLMPGNIDSEFTIPANSTHTVYAQITCDATGAPTSVSIEHADTMPAETAGTMDHAPPLTYIPLADVTTNATGVYQIVQHGRGSRALAAIVRAEECGSNTIAYFYGPTAIDPTGDPFQALVARVTALENP